MYNAVSPLSCFMLADGLAILNGIIMYGHYLYLEKHLNNDISNIYVFSILFQFCLLKIILYNFQ